MSKSNVIVALAFYKISNMKRIFTTLLCLSVFFAGKAQFAVTGGDTITVTGVSSPSNAIVGDGSCRNNGADTITVNWQIISDTAVPGWTYTGFCDKNICYNFSVGERRAFSMAPGATGLLSLHLTQGCVTGTGNVKFLLWNVADSAGTVQLVTFAVDITQGPNCANGIAETAAKQFVLYPDPAKDQLKITLPQNISNGQVDIFNLLGSKVASQSVSSNETVKSFDLSAVEAGFYVAVITEGGKFVAAKKFTKQN